MEYYSAIKSNGFESVVVMWMNLEPDIQSELGQKEKNEYHIYAMDVYIYTMKYYPNIKKNEILPFVATWMGVQISVGLVTKLCPTLGTPWNVA